MVVVGRVFAHLFRQSRMHHHVFAAIHSSFRHVVALGSLLLALLFFFNYAFAILVP